MDKNNDVHFKLPPFNLSSFNRIEIINIMMKFLEYYNK